MKTKIISLLLLVSLLCGVLCGCAGKESDFAYPSRTVVSEGEKFGSYTYSVYDDGGVILTAYEGSEASVTFPASINGKTVVALGTELFAGNTLISSLTIGGGITEIGDYCFYGCTSLVNVSINKKVNKIGCAAFDLTPWLDAQTDEFIVVGDGVLLTYNGSARSVSVPDNIKHLSSAFGMNETLISVTLGDNVLSVGDYAFAFCEALIRVNFGKNITSVGAHAFEGCIALACAELPDGVKTIGEYAFMNCNFLYAAKLGSSLESIGNYAFDLCTRLRSITFPATLTYVGTRAFYECYSLGTVFYGGTQEQFDALELTDSNYIIKDAFKIYNISGGTNG